MKNSGASLSLQTCCVFMSPSVQEEDQTTMLETEAKAVTSFIGCNMSAASSLLHDGSVTKLLGCLVGAPHSYVSSLAAFRVNHSGTKLFALGKPFMKSTSLLCIQHFWHSALASTCLSWPMLATADEKTRVQLERVTIVGGDDQIPNGVKNHETARVIAKGVVLKRAPSTWTLSSNARHDGEQLHSVN